MVDNKQCWKNREFFYSVKSVANILDNYVQVSQEGKGKVLNQSAPEELIVKLKMREWIKSGGMNDDELSKFIDEYLEQGTRLHHPNYMAHQCAVPDIGSAIGDLIHGVGNNAMSLFEMGASAVATELAITEWMLNKVGWDTNKSDAILVHGGSLANLTALLAARNYIYPNAWKDGVPLNTIILSPKNAHVSVSKAAAIIGIGSHSVYELPCDSLGRIIHDEIPKVINYHRNKGRVVMAIITNACAAPTGLYDPILNISKICQSEDIWLHVDAAHGGSALLHSKLQHLLEGIHYADSITWDAHKMLRVSTLAAAVLFRDKHNLYKAFNQNADYLFFDENRPGPDLMHYTIEGSKSEIGLKVFLNLAKRGEAGMAEYIYSRHLAAYEFGEMLCKRDDFELLCKPESNIVCFRYKDESENSNENHIIIRKKLMDKGSFHLASSFVNDKRWFRAVIISPSTNVNSFTRLLNDISYEYQCLV